MKMEIDLNGVQIQSYLDTAAEVNISEETFDYIGDLRPRSHVPVFARPGNNQPGESTTWRFKTSPVLTGQSNEQERCDQAVVHAQ